MNKEVSIATLLELNTAVKKSLDNLEVREMASEVLSLIPESEKEQGMTLLFQLVAETISVAASNVTYVFVDKDIMNEVVKEYESIMNGDE